MIKRLNKACRFFPCHKGLEDCTFCWCPFYPCLAERFGKYTYSQKLKKDLWSCRSCNWIHKKRVVDDLFALIRKTSFPLKDKGAGFRLKRTGVVILGHGSKLSKANHLLSKIILAIKRKLYLTAIVPAYLQLHPPDLARSVENLIRRGCKRVITVPFFLFKGNHVDRDIPEAIKKETLRYPEVEFICTESLGKDRRIREIVLDRIKEVMVKSGN